jgi:sugar phosphate isomerase/epimerase
MNKLDPWAYVLHLDGNELHHNLQRESIERTPNAATDWLERAVQALETLGALAGDCGQLAVENLDGYPPDFSFPILQRISVAQCVDIGHLWKDGADAIAHLKTSLPRTRVIHLHGIDERDHQSLAYMPAHKVDEVISLLIRAPFSGIVTLEVFSESDLSSSLQSIQASLMRIGYP